MSILPNALVVKLPSLGKKNKEGHRAHTLQQRAAVTRQSIPFTRSRGTALTRPAQREAHGLTARTNPIAPFKEKYAEGG